MIDNKSNISLEGILKPFEAIFRCNKCYRRECVEFDEVDLGNYLCQLCGGIMQLYILSDYLYKIRNLYYV